MTASVDICYHQCQNRCIGPVFREPLAVDGRVFWSALLSALESRREKGTFGPKTLDLFTCLLSRPRLVVEHLFTVSLCKWKWIQTVLNDHNIRVTGDVELLIFRAHPTFLPPLPFVSPCLILNLHSIADIGNVNLRTSFHQCQKRRLH